MFERNREFMICVAFRKFGSLSVQNGLGQCIYFFVVFKYQLKSDPFRNAIHNLDIMINISILSV